MLNNRLIEIRQNYELEKKRNADIQRLKANQKSKGQSSEIGIYDYKST